MLTHNKYPDALFMCFPHSTVTKHIKIITLSAITLFKVHSSILCNPTLNLTITTCATTYDNNKKSHYFIFSQQLSYGIFV